MFKIQNPNQEPPASSKSQNQDLKDMDVLCTFKIKIEKYGWSDTSDHIQIRIKMPIPRQKPLESSSAPSQDLKDMDVLYIFKINIESQN